MNDEIARRPTVPTITADRPMFYDRQGRPISTEEFNELLTKHPEYKVVARDEVTLDGVILTVSTVWLGVDHNWARQGPPIVFETMVFGNHPLADEGAQWRYSTEEQAADGHQKVVAAIRAARLTDERLALEPLEDRS